MYDYRRLWIGEWIYWPLIHTYGATANLHNSQITTAHAKPFRVCCVFTSRSLATASNSRDSSASCVQVYLRSHPCRTLIHCQLTRCPIPLLYNSSARTALTAPRFPRCMGNRCRRNVFTEPLSRKGCDITPISRSLHSYGYTRYNIHSFKVYLANHGANNSG
jgi:hypothetical protein